MELQNLKIGDNDSTDVTHYSHYMMSGCNHAAHTTANINKVKDKSNLFYR